MASVQRRQVDESYKRLEDIYRREYTSLQKKSVKEITGAYHRAYEYMAQRLISSRYARNPALIPVLMRELNDVITETQPSIEEQFIREIETMVRHGSGTVVQPLLSNGVTGAEALAQELETLPATIARQAIVYNYTDNEKRRPLSQAIWDPKKRVGILSTVNNGIRAEKSPFEIADELMAYVENGAGFYEAFRLAYTEMVYAHRRADAVAIAQWNYSDVSDFTIVVEQYLSSTHREYDICDVLAGTYKIDEAPTIPRHPQCNCGERKRVLEEMEGKLDTIQQRTKLYRQIIQGDSKIPIIQEFKKGGRIVIDKYFSNKAINSRLKPINYRKEVGNTVYLDKYKIDISDAQRDFINKTNLTYYVNNTNQQFYGRYSIGSHDILINLTGEPNTLSRIKNTFYHELGHGVDYKWNRTREGYKVISDSEPWKILTETGNTFNFEGIDYTRSNEVVNIVFNRIGKDLKMDRAEFWRFSKKHPLSVSGLLKYYYNQREIFAEAYRQYHLNGAEMQKYAPGIYQFLEETL